jgi:hypothetical protein
VSDLLDTTQIPWTPFSSPCFAPLAVNSDGSRITNEKMVILELLETKMQAMFLKSDLAIASIEFESASSNTQIKQHPERGVFVEMSSWMPLPCSMEDAWQLFSEALCNMKAHHSSSYTFTGGFPASDCVVGAKEIFVSRSRVHFVIGTVILGIFRRRGAETENEFS